MQPDETLSAPAGGAGKMGAESQEKSPERRAGSGPSPPPPVRARARARVCVAVGGGGLQLRVQGTLRAAEQVAELRLEPLPRKQTERAA